MARQSQHELGILDANANLATVPTIPERRKRSRSFITIASYVGALGLAFNASPVSAESVPGAAHMASTTPNLTTAGYNTNKVWVTDLAAAEREAQHIAATGANAIRIQEPYTFGGAEVNNDVERLCNAAIAAHDKSLGLIITMAGHYKDGSLGYMPTGVSELRKYTTAVTNLMWYLAGDEHGCVPQEKNITISLFNEPDNPRSNRNQIVNGVWVAPENEVKLLTYSYSRLKTEASKPGLGVNLTLIGGELSSPSAARDNVSFIKKMAQIIKDRKTGRIMDKFALHQYANTLDTSPSAANNYFNPNSVNAVKDYINPLFEVPVIYDELGAISSVPADKEQQYHARVLASVKPFDGTSQGEFYKRFIHDATCNGVEGVMIFHASDDSGDTLRTGTSFPDMSPKPSQRIVNQEFQNDLNGNLICK